MATKPESVFAPSSQTISIEYPWRRNRKFLSPKLLKSPDWSCSSGPALRFANQPQAFVERQFPGIEVGNESLVDPDDVPGLMQRRRHSERGRVLQIDRGMSNGGFCPTQICLTGLLIRSRIRFFMLSGDRTSRTGSTRNRSRSAGMPRPYMPAPSRPTLWIAIRAPRADQLVVDRRDVELAVDSQVLGDHLVGARGRNRRPRRKL